jgi:hypothetical protein
MSIKFDRENQMKYRSQSYLTVSDETFKMILPVMIMILILFEIYDLDSAP